jgi:hypothetical protein
VISETAFLLWDWLASFFIPCRIFYCSILWRDQCSKNGRWTSSRENCWCLWIPKILLPLISILTHIHTYIIHMYIHIEMFCAKCFQKRLPVWRRGLVVSPLHAELWVVRTNPARI